MHPTSRHIDDYLGGELANDTDAATAAHLSICLHCQHRAVGRTTGTVAWQRLGLLGRLVRRASDGSREVQRVAA
jgi:hypothetical protein